MITAPQEKQHDWSTWKPRWTGGRKTPHDFQEQHEPAARLPDGRLRRIVDARLWEAMAPLQQEAAMQIADSFDLIHNGIGYASNNWQRLSEGRGSGGNVSEARARLANIYFDWARKCAAQKISHAMVVDVLCFGHSCRAVDRNRRLKNGSTKINLMKGLALYCELRGWV
jgi:hypothetical protein